jgi:predicted nuclease of predicted toxin-antitoxin system
MRWLLDECVDAELVEGLRRSGHDVVYVAEIAPRASDTEVMELAEREGRLLLTEDKDFGELVFRQRRPVPGLVLLRIGATERQRKSERLHAAVGHLGETLFSRYTVIEEARIRSRPLEPGAEDVPVAGSRRDPEA